MSERSVAASKLVLQSEWNIMEEAPPPTAYDTGRHSQPLRRNARQSKRPRTFTNQTAVNTRASYLLQKLSDINYRLVMEKEHQPDSMATITMKADYPPSEVYSASEPPPVCIFL